METLTVLLIVVAAATWAAVRLAKKLTATPPRDAPPCSGCAGCAPSAGGAKACPAMPNTFQALRLPESKRSGPASS